ncbi:alpha/beta hydrolase [Mesorhizobium sp. SP-1A]|uniref:alpha/beta hydrolase n=1 Tax=Mesorhizobium sp. SP-1A TaxID=3077840 RepID=UPI0028F6EB6C|nr:alpha/beta hydrolase [Mesorhizobium sp. SP-1A]
MTSHPALMHGDRDSIETGAPELLSWTPKSAALPVTFSDTVGLFTPAAAGTEASASALLFVSPWGFEEMCTRKLWRELAEKASLAGIASLRFDYPGTGDALDRDDFSTGLSVWENAILAAAAKLRALSGASRLILIGHGIGATLAAIVAPRLDGVQALALMAPVVSGRFYLRELAAWSKMVDEGLGLRNGQRITGHVAIAGLVMPDAIAAQVKALSIETLPEAPAPHILVVERPMREKDVALSRHLGQLGAEVTRLGYYGYDDLVSNPTIAKQPALVIEQLTEWVAAIAARPGGTRLPVEYPGEPLLAGPDFTETPLRFGPDGRLFGILCMPLGTRRGATVVYLGTAYDRHAGWARTAVQSARHLAAQGVASLRFDAANVGDSPPVTGSPDQVLFSDRQIDDVGAAFELLEKLNLAPAVLAGRCSGAFLAFRSAVQDERCKAAVIVNPFTFVWDPDEQVDDVLRYNPRSLSDYGRRIVSMETFRRLGTGGVDVRRATLNISRQLARRLTPRAHGMLGALSKYGRLREATHAAFRRLYARRMPLSLIYSGADVGLDQYRLYFGDKGEDLAQYANVSVEIVADADHNMTPPAARAHIRDRILEHALLAGAEKEMTAASEN